MDFEIRRKLLHALVGIVLIFLVWFIPETILRILLVLLLVKGIILSLIERKHRIPFFSHMLNLFERPAHRRSFPGKSLIMLIAGTLLAQLFFNNLLVITGLLVVVTGDSLAHLIGRWRGKILVPWDKTKHVEGRIIGWAVTTIIAIIIWENIFLNVSYGIIALAVGITMLVESLPLRKIGLDDNLVMPFVTAIIIYVLTPTLV